MREVEEKVYKGALCASVKTRLTKTLSVKMREKESPSRKHRTGNSHVPLLDV